MGMPCGIGSRAGVTRLQAQGRQGWPAVTRSWRGTWTALPSSPRKGPPASTLVSGSGLQGCGARSQQPPDTGMGAQLA